MVIAMVFMGISIGTLVPALNYYRIKSDAQAIAGLISLARLRAEADFGHASLICSSTVQPYSCQVQVTTSGSATPVTEPQQRILSSGISFATFGAGAPTIGAGNQSTPAQNMTMTFNSRGLPIDSSGNLVSNYAIYLVSQSGTYYATALQANGQPVVYYWTHSTWQLTQ
jgi:hypothetical protein